ARPFPCAAEALHATGPLAPRAPVGGRDRSHGCPPGPQAARARRLRPPPPACSPSSTTHTAHASRPPLGVAPPTYHGGTDFGRLPSAPASPTRHSGSRRSE